MIGDETEYLQTVIGLLPSQRFKTLNSSWVAVMLLLLAITMEVVGLIMILFFPNSSFSCEPLCILLYCHTVLWFLVLFLDHVFKWHHNRLRLEGYLTAYEQMNKYGSLPFYIVSMGNTAMLLIVTVHQQSKGGLPIDCTNDWNSPLVLALSVISLEVSVLSYILIRYLVNVYRFNLARALPDVSNLDTWEAFTSHEVGFREHGENIQELLEKQADSIRYYKDAVEVLQRKVMGLTAQLRGDSIN